MLELVTTRVGVALRRIVDHVGHLARSLSGSGPRDGMPGLCRRRGALQPDRVRERREPDLF